VGTHSTGSYRTSISLEEMLAVVGNSLDERDMVEAPPRDPVREPVKDAMEPDRPIMAPLCGEGRPWVEGRPTKKPLLHTGGRDYQQTGGGGGNSKRPTTTSSSSSSSSPPTTTASTTTRELHAHAHGP
jgi:hypothetical protein